MMVTSEFEALAVHRMEEVAGCVSRIILAMRTAGFDAHDLFGTRLALEEALVNAIRHGNRGDISKWVDVRFRLVADQLLIQIEDQGRGFDPDGLPDPRSPENLERAGGRGVFLIRHYMTWVQYNETGNRVTLCKVKSR
jgi:serine/threonine-protein kinase RsbW